CQRLQSFKLQVPALQLPLVVLLEQQRANETRYGGFVREDAHDIGAPLDLGVEPLQWVCGVDLHAMRLREGHEGEHVGLGVIHQRCELGELGSELIGDDAPLLDRRFVRVLREHGVDQREHHLPLTLAGVRERRAQKMHAAALPGGLEDLGDGGLDAQVRIGDHELHAPQASAGQRAQEARPERLRLRGADRHAEHFPSPVGVHGYGNYYGHRHDPAGLPHFQVRGIDPQVRPVALDRAIEERMHALVDLRAQPRDLAFADPAHPHRLHQLVDRAGGDALHVRFLDHGGEGLLGGAPRLEKAWKIAAFTQLRDLQIYRSGSRLPEPLSVAVAAVEPLGAPLGIAGRAQALHVHVHHALGDVLDHLPQQIGVRALFHELGECDIGLGGHRDVLRFRLDGVVTPTLNQTHDDRLRSLRGPHRGPRLPYGSRAKARIRRGKSENSYTTGQDVSIYARTTSKLVPVWRWKSRSPQPDDRTTPAAPRFPFSQLGKVP